MPRIRGTLLADQDAQPPLPARPLLATATQREVQARAIAVVAVQRRRAAARTSVEYPLAADPAARCYPCHHAPAVVSGLSVGLVAGSVSSGDTAIVTDASTVT